MNSSIINTPRTSQLKELRQKRLEYFEKQYGLEKKSQEDTGQSTTAPVINTRQPTSTPVVTTRQLTTAPVVTNEFAVAAEQKTTALTAKSSERSEAISRPTCNETVTPRTQTRSQDSCNNTILDDYDDEDDTVSLPSIMIDENASLFTEITNTDILLQPSIRERLLKNDEQSNNKKAAVDTCVTRVSQDFLDDTLRGQSSFITKHFKSNGDTETSMQRNYRSLFDHKLDSAFTTLEKEADQKETLVEDSFEGSSVWSIDSSRRSSHVKRPDYLTPRDDVRNDTDSVVQGGAAGSLQVNTEQMKAESPMYKRTKTTAVNGRAKIYHYNHIDRPSNSHVHAEYIKHQATINTFPPNGTVSVNDESSSGMFPPAKSANPYEQTYQQTGYSVYKPTVKDPPNNVISSDMVNPATRGKSLHQQTYQQTEYSVSTPPRIDNPSHRMISSDITTPTTREESSVNRYQQTYPPTTYSVSAPPTMKSLNNVMSSEMAMPATTGDFATPYQQTYAQSRDYVRTLKVNSTVKIKPESINYINLSIVLGEEKLKRLLQNFDESEDYFTSQSEEASEFVNIWESSDSLSPSSTSHDKFAPKQSFQTLMQQKEPMTQSYSEHHRLQLQQHSVTDEQFAIVSNVKPDLRRSFAGSSYSVPAAKDIVRQLNGQHDLHLIDDLGLKTHRYGQPSFAEEHEENGYEKTGVSNKQDASATKVRCAFSAEEIYAKAGQGFVSSSPVNQANLLSYSTPSVSPQDLPQRYTINGGLIIGNDDKLATMARAHREHEGSHSSMPTGLRNTTETPVSKGPSNPPYASFSIERYFQSIETLSKDGISTLSTDTFEDVPEPVIEYTPRDDIHISGANFPSHQKNRPNESLLNNQHDADRSVYAQGTATDHYARVLTHVVPNTAITAVQSRAEIVQGINDLGYGKTSYTNQVTTSTQASPTTSQGTNAGLTMTQGHYSQDSSPRETKMRTVIPPEPKPSVSKSSPRPAHSQNNKHPAKGKKLFLPSQKQTKLTKDVTGQDVDVTLDLTSSKDSDTASCDTLTQEPGGIIPAVSEGGKQKVRTGLVKSGSMQSMESAISIEYSEKFENPRPNMLGNLKAELAINVRGSTDSSEPSSAQGSQKHRVSKVSTVMDIRVLDDESSSTQGESIDDKRKDRVEAGVYQWSNEMATSSTQTSPSSSIKQGPAKNNVGMVSMESMTNDQSLPTNKHGESNPEANLGQRLAYQEVQNAKKGQQVQNNSRTELARGQIVPQYTDNTSTVTERLWSPQQNRPRSAGAMPPQTSDQGYSPSSGRRNRDGIVNQTRKSLRSSITSPSGLAASNLHWPQAHGLSNTIALAKTTKPERVRPSSAGKVSKSLHHKDCSSTTPSKSVCLSNGGSEKSSNILQVHSVSKSLPIKGRFFHRMFCEEMQNLVVQSPRIVSGEQSLLMALPEEILLMIFKWLLPGDLVKCMQVCTHLHRLCLDVSLWRTVRVNKTALTDQILATIAERRPRSLQLVHCTGSQVSENALRDLFTKCGPKLRELNISYSARGTMNGNNVLVHAMSCCPTLTSVNVGGCNVTDGAVMALCEASQQLRRLNVSGCQQLTDEGLISIVEKHGLYLERLEIQGCFNITARGMSSVSNKCKGLKHLNVGQCWRLSENCFIQLAHNLTHLHTLDVRGCKQATDKCVHEIVKNLTNLTSLSIASCSNITSNSLTEIATYCPHIEHLDAYGCKGITNEGIQYLARGCLRLKFLDLSSTSISGKGVVTLANYCSHTLQVLKLNFCQHITSAQIEKVLENCRGLRKLFIYGVRGLVDINELRKVNLSVHIESDHVTQL